MAADAQLTARRSAGLALLASKQARTAVWIAFCTLIVAMGSIMMLFPLAWMLSTSFKASGDVLLLPPKWVPVLEFEARWQNYPEALSFIKAGRVLRNTLTIALTTMVGDTLSAALVAYGFARLRARGKDFLFAIVLSTLMLPYYVRLVPEFLLFKQLGWVNTFLPLIVPSFFAGPFNIFLLRQFFTTIPIEMDDAAKIDGASYFQIFWRIIVPLSWPAIATVAIFSFMFHWNDFFRPMIYLSSASKWTIALALRNFVTAYGGTPWNLLMAASIVALLPTLLVFFVAQRYFIQGIVVSGVKG
jgi:ABC-type glycerol-3-phosphate transport system permease component